MRHGGWPLTFISPARADSCLDIDSPKTISMPSPICFPHPRARAGRPAIRWLSWMDVCGSCAPHHPGVLKLLDEKGKFCLILPTLEAIKFRTLAEKKGLNLSKLLRVKSRTDKDTEIRHLMQFEFKPSEFSECTIAIELTERHEYTTDYKELTKEYYLNF